MDNMIDLQIFDLIRNGMENFQNTMEKVQNDLEKVQGLLDKAMGGNKKIASLLDELVLDLHEHEEESIILNGIVEDECIVEDELTDLGKNSCDESDVVDGESLLQLFTEVAAPHMLKAECITDVEVLDKCQTTKTTFKSALYSVSEFELHDTLTEYCDPFWVPILTSSIEAQMRFLFMKMALTTSPDMILDMTDNPSLKRDDGYLIIRCTIMRDYDGFNGPGSFQAAFHFVSALVRDYDGFNGPGHTLRTRCLRGGSHVMVLYSIRGFMNG